MRKVVDFMQSEQGDGFMLVAALLAVSIACCIAGMII